MEGALDLSAKPRFSPIEKLPVTNDYSLKSVDDYMSESDTEVDNDGSTDSPINFSPSETSPPSEKAPYTGHDDILTSQADILKGQGDIKHIVNERKHLHPAFNNSHHRLSSSSFSSGHSSPRPNSSSPIDDATNTLKSTFSPQLRRKKTSSTLLSPVFPPGVSSVGSSPLLPPGIPVSSAMQPFNMFQMNPAMAAMFPMAAAANPAMAAAAAAANPAMMGSLFPFTGAGIPGQAPQFGLNGLPGQQAAHLIDLNAMNSLTSSPVTQLLQNKRRKMESPSPSNLLTPKTSHQQYTDPTTTEFMAGTDQDGYCERRRKNNEAAKRSRENRRMKEEGVAIRAALLEQENIKLKAQVAVLKNETMQLHCMLYNM